MGRPQRLAGHFEREGLQAFLEFVDVVDPLIDEFLVGKSVVEDVPGDRGEPDEIGARPRMEEHIGALGHLVLAQVGDDQLLAVHLVGTLDARREHRMAFGRIAADDQHQAGLLDI